MADESASEAPSGPGSPAAAGGDGKPGDFERYALIAALTLVVLCLLVWDRWHDGALRRDAPPPDRALRVEIGGGSAPSRDSAPRSPPSDEKRASVDPPAAPPAPPPVAPAQRTCTVKEGDSLYEIARRELGSSGRAKEIADLNGIADPAKIRTGQILKLPAR